MRWRKREGEWSVVALWRGFSKDRPARGGIRFSNGKLRIGRGRPRGGAFEIGLNGRGPSLSRRGRLAQPRSGEDQTHRLCPQHRLQHISRFGASASKKPSNGGRFSAYHHSGICSLAFVGREKTLNPVMCSLLGCRIV